MMSPRTLRIVAPLSLLSALVITSGCDSSGGDETTSSSASNGSGGNSTGTAGAGGDGGNATSSGGNTGSGGAGGIDMGPPDVTANMRYINQRVFREDDAFAMGGTAQLEIYNPQELPADNRSEFMNADGERCTYESGTEWPYSPGGDATWPTGPYQDGGNVTLTASGAPGPVVYEYFDTYYLRFAPGPVEQGSFTHNSFFPPEYIPHGAAVTVETAGGPDLGAFTVPGLELATDYVVSSPNMVAGGTTIDADADLTFSWSPPAPGDQMAVIVKDSFSFVKCMFDDDGQGTVPAAAMANLNGGQFVRFTVQTWREHTETKRAESADGKQVDVEFLSRHVQIGRFDTQ